MFSSGKLYEFGGDVDAVRRIVNCLAAATTDIVFIPAIAVELMLLTRVTKSYSESAIVQSVAIDASHEPA